MKLRKLLSAALTLILILPVEGCYDRIELEGMAFVVSLGLDKGPDNTIDVTARIAVPRKLAGVPGGGGGGGDGKEEAVGGAKPITVRAHSIPEALNLFNSTVERRISLLHLANIAIGESLAKEGVVEYLRPLTRYREFRRTVVVFIIPGNVREAYEQNKPILEQSITRFTESLTDVGMHTGLSASKKLHDFLVSLEALHEDPIAPVIAVNQKVKQQSGKSSDGETAGMEESNLSFEPGKVVRMGGNPAEFIGTAVFRDDRLVAYLDGIDTRMLLSIRGELMRTQMDFPDPVEKGKFIGVELKHARSPVINVDLRSNPVRIHLRQRLEGDLLGVQGGTDYTNPEKMNLLENSISDRLQKRQEALIKRMFHEYQTDPFGIFKRARGQFADYAALRAFDYREKLRNAVVNVDVDVQLRRTGIQLAPIEPR
ncbi:Ger(x)C family spore germination protein [Effusibacillus lacus]|uniref:Uncharacterized protein n=1 Tax=Effusibacillus lacus TaxID=1348429 RepID=A0A292YSQ1_9BACL|nr:Ger(x)C family spore germination protein [Effusibacillus lacus]TCS73565.1 Ger(x)C family germination protein [Effusibacillus lacus]GAX91941.1 hypothetical protein EFBL_3632 [Effusibacillus lacus]